MYLTGTFETLQVILAGAVTTNQSVVTVDYGENTLTTFVAGKQRSVTNGATAVDILAAPSLAGTQRIVQLLTMTNQDTAPITVTIRTNNAGTLAPQFGPVTLQVGERIQFATDTGFTVYTVTGAVKVTAVASTVEPGYIDGLLMQYATTTTVTFLSGSAYIPSVGANVNLVSNVTRSVPSPAASTQYHAYLFLNSGVPDVEIVTTAPSSAYNGTARTKTGDTTRRYLGSIITDSTAVVMNFMQPQEGRVIYRTPSGAAPQAVLSTGTATSATAVSCAAVVPVTVSAATITFVNNANAGSNMRVLESLGSYGATGSLYGVTAGVALSADMPLNASREFQYYMTTAPSGGGGNAQVTGYTFLR